MICMNITKAIIPAAGLGTRFLPFTKSVPKELLPIMETPAIQFIVEEGLKSGITEFEIIANQTKHAIAEYFSKNAVLEHHLQETNKLSYLTSINNVISQSIFNYIPQPEPLGLGHAILMAKNSIHNEYFGILLPDEIMMGKTAALAQLIAVTQQYNTSVIAVQEVPHESVSSYGIVAIKKQLNDNLFDIADLIEKPATHEAPSNLAIIGRYILSSHIFNALEQVKPGSGNEIQLTDGIEQMMHNGEKVLAYKVDTVRHDIGNPVGWLQANIYYGLSHESTKSPLKNYIQQQSNLK